MNVFHDLAYREKRVALGSKYEILEGVLRGFKLSQNPRFLAMPGKDGFEEVVAQSLGLEPRRLHTIEREKLIYEYQRAQGYTTTEQACEFENAMIEICRRPIKYDFVHFDFPSMLTEPIQGAIEKFLGSDMLQENSIFAVTTIAFRTSKKAKIANQKLAGGTYKFPPTHLFLNQTFNKFGIRNKVTTIPYITEFNYSATTCVVGFGCYERSQG